MILIPGIALGALLWLWRRSRNKTVKMKERNRRALIREEDGNNSGGSRCVILSNAQNVEIYVRVWNLPVSQGVVVLLHSFGLRSDCFDEIVSALNHRRYAVVTYDMQGHGLSGTNERARVDLRRFEHLIQDAEKIVHFTRRECPEVPVFVLGEGFGATVALHLGMKAECRYIQGLILCNPFVLPNVDNNPPSHIAPVFMALEKVMPDVRISTPELTHVRDPSMFYSPTLRFFVQAHRALLQLERRLHHVKTPFVTIHGSRDERSSPRHSRTLFSKAPATDKTVMVYDNMRSCLLGEFPDDRSHVISDILAWLDRRTQMITLTAQSTEPRGQRNSHTKKNSTQCPQLTSSQQTLLTLLTRNGFC